MALSIFRPQSLPRIQSNLATHQITIANNEAIGRPRYLSRRSDLQTT